MTAPGTNEPLASKASWEDYAVVLAGWPTISIVTLFVFALLSSLFEEHTTYTTSYDLGFFRYTVWAVLGHTAAFIAPIYVLRKSLRRCKEWFVLAVMILAIAGQLMLRWLATQLGHIDCSDNCVDTIMPQQLDATVSWIVAISLIVAFFVAAIRYTKSKNTI